MAYRAANYPESGFTQQQIAADKIAIKSEFSAAKANLRNNLTLNTLYPQKPQELSRPNSFFKWDINILMGGMGGVTVGGAIGGLIGLVGGPLGSAIGAGLGGVIGGAIGTVAAIITPHIAQRTKPAIYVT